MTEAKTIKDIDDETWGEFKSLAAKSHLKLGSLFKTMVKEHKKNASGFWSVVLHGEKILSDDEARDISLFVKSVRKQSGFRQ